MVVPDEVFPAIVLVVAAGGPVVDQVVLQADARRALIVVESLAAGAGAAESNAVDSRVLDPAIFQSSAFCPRRP